MVAHVHGSAACSGDTTSTADDSHTDVVASSEGGSGAATPTDDGLTFPCDALREWADVPCCARYLRARQWDVAKAVAMLQATLEWRHSFFGGGDLCGKRALLWFDLEALRGEMSGGKMHVSGGTYVSAVA